MVAGQFGEIEFVLFPRRSKDQRGKANFHGERVAHRHDAGPTRSSKQSPIFVLKGQTGAWPMVFREEFDLLWEGSENLLTLRV